MTIEDEIFDIENRLNGMSFGNINYSTLNQRLLVLRDKQKIEHDKRAEQRRKVSESKWDKKPLGLIFIGVAGSVLTACIIYLLAVYFGVHL